MKGFRSKRQYFVLSVLVEYHIQTASTSPRNDNAGLYSLTLCGIEVLGKKCETRIINLKILPN